MLINNHFLLHHKKQSLNNLQRLRYFLNEKWRLNMQLSLDGSNFLEDLLLSWKCPFTYINCFCLPARNRMKCYTILGPGLRRIRQKLEIFIE